MIDTDTSFSDLTTRMWGQDGKLVVHRTQDVEPYLESNQKAYNAAPDWRPYGSGRKDQAMRHVANVPMVVIEQWMKEGVNVLDPSPEMQKKVAGKLNDYTNRKLRTYPGRVGYRA